MARRGCGLDLILAHGKSYKVGAAFPVKQRRERRPAGMAQSSGPPARIVGLRHADGHVAAQTVPTFCASSPFLPEPTPVPHERSVMSPEQIW
jgi:hypothetical protein